jgi:hypothetical protein
VGRERSQPHDIAPVVRIFAVRSWRRDIVAAVWDPGWDEPQPPRVDDEASSGAPDDASDDVPPGRWYAPTTRRGKVILLITVAVVLVVTVVACCIGIAGLAKLRSVDSSGFV